MKFIKDDIAINFMGARKKALIGSGIVCAAALLCIVTFGLNQGIDFRGGSAVIVAFQEGAISDRSTIGDSMQTFLEDEIGKKGTQITVQDFDTGAGTAEPVDYFRIYTEVTSLISPEKQQKIVETLQAKFGDKTRAETRGENADTFYVNFPEAVNILERKKALQAMFQELGYAKVDIKTQYERELEVEYWQDVHLLLADKEEAAEGEVEGQQQAPTLQEFEAKKERDLQGKKDRSFTVNVEELRAKVAARLKADFAGAFKSVESATSVSPSVGRDLLNNGLLAILYALIGILIYITVRFDFRYAPGAVVALIHDVTITIGLFALFQVKFSLPIIAALLTIVGYSLNDTIVVLDRVRETFDTYRGRSLIDLLNRGVNETLSRTVLTSMTTMMVVIAILVFGGGQIGDFAWALFIGIIVGTYSSIFIASPLVFYMDQYITRRDAQRTSARSGSDDNKPKDKQSRRRAKAAEA